MQEAHDVQLVAVSFADGSVGIMQFVLNPSLGQKEQESVVGYDPKAGYRAATDAAVKAEIGRTAWSSAVLSWRRIESEDLPSSREFRGAWADTGEAIDHDMDKAREIQRERIRAQRAVALTELDGQWMRATGTNDQGAASAIEQKRQVLRDAPADPRIDAAETIEDLKAIALPE